MKVIKKVIIFVLVVALLAFTAVYLINAYNSGKIGNKAEKVAADFETELLGTWNGTYSISSLTFDKEEKASITMLGIKLDGTYSDTYDLEKAEHTLTLNYNSSLGISVTRTYVATVNDNKLTLVDTQAGSIQMTYTKGNANNEAASATGKTEQDTTTLTTGYNPGIEVFSSNLMGKWVSSTNSNSGYTFVDSSTVTVSLIGVNYNGTHSVYVEENTNKYVLKITYASVAGINISNSYYTAIDDNNLTLIQKGADSIHANYTKSSL